MNQGGRLSHALKVIKILKQSILKIASTEKYEILGRALCFLSAAVFRMTESDAGCLYPRLKVKKYKEFPK